MGKFNWWRREKPKRKLDPKKAFIGKSLLLQKIEHGDYDYSDFYRQAKDELRRCKEEQAKVTKSWVASPESLREKIDEIQRKYMKRHNRLMEDHHQTEHKLLTELKQALIREFGVDVWDKTVSCCKGDLVALYWEYKKVANETSGSKETSAN
jgi:uncharacterized NAD(P)/FAD-binding protein YdhS